MSPHNERAAAEHEAEARVRSVFPQVRHYLLGLLDDYRRHHAPLGSALVTLLDQGRQDPYEFSLPLLVHSAITGAPEPAVPVAGVHALWWRSANVLDDVVDGDAGDDPLPGVARSVAMMAALEGGYALPLRALEAAPLPAPVRRRLTDDYLSGWTRATDGQISDILNRPEEVGTEEVLEVYRKKSAAVYEMACAMAARLACSRDPHGPRDSGGSRAEERVVAAWAEFGHLLGLLAQFRNDHDDLRDGPGDDLRNGTATYLLVHLLRTVPGPRRERAVGLLGRVAGAKNPKNPKNANTRNGDDGEDREDRDDREEERRELADMMRAADVVGPYNELLADLSRRAHVLLAALAPESPFADCLRTRVDAEAALLEPLGTADAG